MTQCQTGAPAAIAASILQAAGNEVINMVGGLATWTDVGLEVDSTDLTTCDTGSGHCT